MLVASATHRAGGMFLSGALPSPPVTRIGLSLSGGGVRAAALHLGLLKLLARGTAQIRIGRVDSLRRKPGDLGDDFAGGREVAVVPTASSGTSTRRCASS